MKNLSEKIAACEKTARLLEPSHSERIALRKQVMSITDKFLNDLEEMPAYINHENSSIKSLKADFPDLSDPEMVFQEIKDEVDIPGINPASGNHLGYIPGGGLYTSALGDYWADVTNRYSGIFFADPGAVKIENELIRWMISLVGYPENAWGNLASGGSIANLAAIVTAREAKAITPSKIERSVIYLTAQTHHCIIKALRIAGLHYGIIKKVPMDDQLKMDPAALEKMVREDMNSDKIPFLVVSSAGTTDAGIIDPIESIDAVAKKYNLWHHVDAAYGGFFLLAESCYEKLKSISLPDSIVMDPHKSLFLPYGLGVYLVKDRQHLFNTFSYEANYMQDARENEIEISPAEVSPELTKHFRGLRMWLPLKIHGVTPFRAGLEEKHYLAIYFYERIKKIKGIEVFMKPELSVVMFRYVDNVDNNRFNRELVKEIHNDGRIFLSSTTINKNFWLRVAILVFRTHKNTIDLTVRILEEKISELKTRLEETV